jgi:dolichol kinase
MLAVFICLAGLFVLLVIAEFLRRKKLVTGEYHRKLLHIAGGTFIAFWPWLISYRAIQLIALAMIAVMLINRYVSVFNYQGILGRARYGDMLYALAVVLTAAFAHDKIIFALAILQVALADGLAAVLGIRYGKYWGYKFLNSKKTVIGSMVFWLVSASILGVGLLYLHDSISFRDYYLLITLLPPLLTFAENISIYGIDNIVLPLLTVIILRAVQS